jgi:hypothetical protein
VTTAALHVTLGLVADVGGSGAASDVTSGAVLTLVIPLALLVVVIAWWWLAVRRGWPAVRNGRGRAEQPPAAPPPR